METKESWLNFAVVGGTFIDFAHLDLSPWRIQGGFVESKKTEDFIRNNSMTDSDDRNWKLVKDISQSSDGLGGSGMHGDWEFMNLLWPIDFNNPPTEEEYFEAIGAIKIIHPSELYIQNIINAQYFPEKGIYFSGWSTFNHHYWQKYKEPRNHYFIYPEEYIEETNKFLAFYKGSHKKRNYIRNAIRYYLDSFNVNSVEMSFICLCICLETIVPGKEQLSYRFRRNLAVLCADSYDSGEKIYTNAKLLYEYRSKLVHSGMTKKDFNKFELFFEYAQIIASRMIIEMLLHDLPSIEELDKKLTEFGFGQGSTITKGYKKFQGNNTTWLKVSEYEI